MSTSIVRKAARKSTAAVTVPRDRDAAAPSRRNDAPPSPADVNPRDEDIHTDREKPLVADSHEARALHHNRPRAPGQLDVGTAGDAARPSKPGIHGKPLPPRQDVGGPR